jgi:hypothetical protein
MNTDKKRQKRQIRPIARGLLLFAVLSAFLSEIAIAAVRLPLDGYCRPGRYFPIEIGQGDAAHFFATGALSTDVAAVSRPRTIIPMLVLAVPGDLHWAGGSLPLRFPGEHERLVAFDENTPNVADLFPDDRILPVHLDAVDPLPGPPAAWSALDAVVLDSTAMARVNEGQRSALLAAAVMLAVPGPVRPDDRWPWQSRGAFWVLSYVPLGPVDQLVCSDAYSPTFAWTPGWSGAIRAQIATAALLLFLAIVAIAMFRNRWAAFGLIALSLLSAGAIAVWQRSLGTVSRAGGDVIVRSQGLVQRDAWVFERARLRGERVVPWTGWTVPIFGSTRSVEQTAMRIEIAADGSASFDFELDRGKTIAFVRRNVLPGSPPPIVSVDNSPMRESARAIYLGKGDRILGETTGAGDRWPGVEIGR